VSASLGASLDLKKLLIYPVPHQKLFMIEVLLRLTTCAEMLLLLAGSMTGLLRNPTFGGMAAAPRIIAPFLLFVLFNLLLSAGLRNLLERLPAMFLPDPMAAIVEKELRALSRTPRFRMVFIMGFSFGLLVWLPITFGRRGQGNTIVADHYLTIVSVYALTLLGQVSYLNTFGFDRSAAQIYFSVPVSMRKAFAGKNVAAALFILVEMVAVTLVSARSCARIPVGKVVEAY